MPFKIVQTNEGGKVILTAIPSQWEEDNILYWPPKCLTRKLRSLLIQEDSVPDKKKWDRTPCILKRKEFASIDEADDEILIMEQNSDTETEIPKQSDSLRRKRVKLFSGLPSFNDEVPLAMRSGDFITPPVNNLFETENMMQLPSTSKDIIIWENRSLNTNGIPATTVSDVSYVDDGPSLMTSNREKSHCSEALIQDFVVLADNTKNYPLKQDTDRDKLSTIIENQKIIIEQQIKLQNSIDALATILSNSQSQPIVTQKEVSTDYELFQPVDTVEKLNSLDKQLEDETYFNNVVKNLSFVCGQSGKANGLDSCYKLIDYFLSRDFVIHCSWTGISRKSGINNKIPLKFYSHFRKCFLAIILQADKNFSEMECESFFKRIMKNSVARSDSKRIISTHKSRPRNLIYKKKRDSNSTSKGKKYKEQQLATSCSKQENEKEVNDNKENEFSASDADSEDS